MWLFLFSPQIRKSNSALPSCVTLLTASRLHYHLGGMMPFPYSVSVDRQPHPSSPRKKEASYAQSIILQECRGNR